MSDPTTYFNRTYDETMSLLIETRNYIAYHESNDHRKLSTHTRLQASYESMRITSRLTQAMAWLLAQKAVHAGELTIEQLATEQYSLAGGEVCSDPSGPENEMLPPALRSLLDRSHKIYMRISRLDYLVRRRVA
ncbi:regulator of CtrA degradation [Azospirillaceae bacterium]